MNAGNLATPQCVRGPLVSVEGISGAGKTFLTKLTAAQLAAAGREVTSISDFTSRSVAGGVDLGREFLHALSAASGGDRFLRGGHLHAETLLLLAIKTYDYEAISQAAGPGQVIIEGRSIDTTAVYQSLLMHPGNDAEALEQARRILHLARLWRPLPDLTILISGDPQLALDRASQRNQRPFLPEERLTELRASSTYRQLAAEDPARICVLDPDGLDPQTSAAMMANLITSAASGLNCRPYPGTSCGQACRFATPSAERQGPAWL
jgi:dTMP kinase